MPLSAIIPESETITMQVIRYCEAHRILNERCNLSTIESLRRQSPEEVRVYLKFLQGLHGEVACPKKAGGCSGVMTWDEDAAHYYCPKCDLWLNPAG